MIQFECHKVIHPLMLITFGLYYPSITAFETEMGQGARSRGQIACSKRTHCMWIVNKMKIYFEKIGFVDSKLYNLTHQLNLL